MRTHTARISRLEALPTIRTPRVYDFGRLTPLERKRYDGFERKVALVGLDGLTDPEIEEAARLAELALVVARDGIG